MAVLCLSMVACSSNDESPNQTPTAAFMLSRIDGIRQGVIYISIPLCEEVVNIQFDASMSNDPDGDILSYVWDFGDGNTGEGMQVNHAYGEPSNIITVTLTVTDNEGASHQSSVQLLITKRVTPP